MFIAKKNTACVYMHINEWTSKYVHIYKYIYIYVCICVYIYVQYKPMIWLWWWMSPKVHQISRHSPRLFLVGDYQDGQIDVLKLTVSHINGHLPFSQGSQHPKYVWGVQWRVKEAKLSIRTPAGLFTLLLMGWRWLEQHWTRYDFFANLQSSIFLGGKLWKKNASRLGSGPKRTSTRQRACRVLRWPRGFEDIPILAIFFWDIITIFYVLQGGYHYVALVIRIPSEGSVTSPKLQMTNIHTYI